MPACQVTQAEGFGKDALFRILDKLEADTRPLLAEARKALASSKGDGALDPWNTGFKMAGDVTAKMDPYFPFEKSVESWGRSFAALGIGYRGAAMDLDLLDRKRKYSNGFCHWPQPAWRRSDGSWQPSVAHFTSLADPASVGSGLTALTTLMHEAGHAAHFANIGELAVGGSGAICLVGAPPLPHPCCARQTCPARSSARSAPRLVCRTRSFSPCCLTPWSVTHPGGRFMLVIGLGWHCRGTFTRKTSAPRTHSRCLGAPTRSGLVV